MKSYLKSPVDLAAALAILDPKDLPTREDARAEALRLLVKGQSTKVDMTAEEQLEKGCVVKLRVESELPRFNKESVSVNLGGGLYDKVLEESLVGKRVGDTGVVTTRDVEVRYEVLSAQRKVPAQPSDELAEALGLPGVHTVEDYVDYTEKKLLDNAWMPMLDKCLITLGKGVEVELDEDEVQEYLKLIRRDMTEHFKKKGIDVTKEWPDEVREAYGGKDFEDYMTKNHRHAQWCIATFLLLCAALGVEPEGENNVLSNGTIFSQLMQRLVAVIKEDVLRRRDA